MLALIDSPGLLFAALTVCVPCSASAVLFAVEIPWSYSKTAIDGSFDGAESKAQVDLGGEDGMRLVRRVVTGFASVVRPSAVFFVFTFESSSQLVDSSTGVHSLAGGSPALLEWRF